MATKLLNQEPAMQNIRQFGIFDDFYDFTAVAEAGTSGTSVIGPVSWKVTKDVSCTAAIDADGVGGLLVITTDNVDDENIYLHNTNEIFKVATDKPMFAVMRAKLECTTNNYASMIFGLMDGVADNALVDATGQVADSKHHVVIYKPTDAATLKVSSTGATAGVAATAYNQDTTEISIPETYCTYAIAVEPVSSTDKRVTYYYDAAGGVNLQQLRDSANLNPIQHTWSLADTSAATGELALMAGIKAGSNEAQVLTIDYIGCWQLR